MKIFVSGVAGFLGSHLARSFINEGHRVVGIDNLIGGELLNVPAKTDFHPVDCNDLERVKKHMRGCDVVYHLAATAHEGLSVFSPHANAKNGYMASAAVFGAAADVGVKRVIFTSSMARYGKQDSLPFTEDMTPAAVDPYGVGKVSSELLLRNLAITHGFEHVIAVPHNIAGRSQRYFDPFRNVMAIFINLMLQGRQPYIYGDGKQERCFSHYSDCIDPLIRMATSPVVGETINIGPDDGVVTILELAEKIWRHLCAQNLFKLPFRPNFIPDRPCEVKVAHCSADKARRLLGYKPKVTLDEMITEMIGWIREEGTRPFEYHLDIEIDSEKVPKTWKDRIF